MKVKVISIPALALLLFSCKTAYEVKKTEKAEYVFTDTTNTSIDSTIYSFILPYKKSVDGAMSSVLAESDSALVKGNPESKLGDFVSDACMSEAAKVFYPADGKQADFAFFNTGGLRRSLPAGKITRGDVFELMPFENELVVLQMNGVLVKKISNFIASKDGAPVAGIRFEIKDKEAVNIMIQNQPLDTTKTYKVLTSDYLANGGDSYDFLISVPQERVNLKVRDAIMQYIMAAGKAGRKISVSTDGRISHAR